MYLGEILKGLCIKGKSTLPHLDVQHIACDSREVRRRGLFIAIKGYAQDGHDFISDAIIRGAKVIVAERPFEAPAGVAKIFLESTASAMPTMAGNFYHHPYEKLRMIGVTGTNGKTTITYLLENIFKRAGYGTGVIGTINYRFGKTVVASRNTTPGPLELMRLLSEMLKENSSHVIMEVSSHSLDQRRVDNIFFDTAILTNITSEHLDYHKTMENYFEAKKRLFFENLKDGGIAILNNDDERAASLKKLLKKTLTFGMEKKADVTAEEMRLSLSGSSFRARTPAGTIDINTGLIGRHNISNILASIAASVAEGIGLERIRDGIESFKSVPGRLETIEAGQPFKIFVDYAHTEDALYNILSLLRGVATGKIITVFGCGGDRDRKKRPLMGHVSCKYSDRVIITSDNPRSEVPRRIIDEIEKGVEGEFSNYEIVEERAAAIAKALKSALKDDIVVIAGKGHEKYQIIKNEEIPFDDCEVARAILSKTKKA